jgi:hypothetical protein
MCRFLLSCSELSGGDEQATERSELLKLRVAIRLHESEMSKLQAKLDDVQAKASGVEEALRTATTKNRLLEEERDKLVQTGRQHAVTAAHATLLQEELAKIREKLSNESTLRAKLETEFGVAKIDLEHSVRRAETAEARMRQAEAKVLQHPPMASMMVSACRNIIPIFSCASRFVKSLFVVSVAPTIDDAIACAHVQSIRTNSKCTRVFVILVIQHAVWKSVPANERVCLDGNERWILSLIRCRCCSRLSHA